MVPAEAELAPSKLAGAILTGGRSRRMGGGPKALQQLGGRSLIGHVIERFSPQVDELFLSVEKPDPVYEPFGLRQVADPLPGSRGPLGGLLAALDNAAPDFEWLAVAPCDAPFLPGSLVPRLLECARSTDLPGAVVQDDAGLQPAFSLWHRGLLDELRHAVMGRRMAGFKQFLDERELAVLDWPPDDGHPFFNINDPAALARAERLLDRQKRTSSTCSA